VADSDESKVRYSQGSMLLSKGALRLVYLILAYIGLACNTQ